MAQGIYRITEEFEKALCEYTGAPFVVTIDNCSNALFLALYWERHFGTFRQESDKPTILLPKHTYPSVPCEVIHAGYKIEFVDGWNSPKTLKGAYSLYPSNVIDSALSFHYNMYKIESFTCVSFTGPYKHLKLGKGGAILTDNKKAASWFKRARYSGRREKSYMTDKLDMLGWNFYMMPEIAARGLLLMRQFYTQEGRPISLPDIEHEYPDLSKFKVYR